jgi:hypothetical protein
MIKLINRLKQMELEPKDVFSMSEVQDFIIKLNRFNQIFVNGETVDGFNIGTYGVFTEQLNQGRIFTLDGVSKSKRAGTNYFLLDQGDFLRSFRVRVTINGFEIYAEDSGKYDQPLEQRFGKLVGLSEESRDQLKEFLLPILIKQVRKQAFA